MPGAKSRRLPFFYGYIVSIAAFLCMLVMWGAYYSFGIFFTPLLEEFGWTRAMTSGAFSLSFVLTGVFNVVAGRLTDRFGPRVVVTICGIFLGLGYILVSVTQAFWQLYLFYGVVVAMGMGSAVTPLQSTVARWFTKRRGMMTGMVVAGIGVGMLISPPLANWLIEDYGWRTSYRIVGITSLIVMVLAAQVLRRDPQQMGLLPYGGNERHLSTGLSAGGLNLMQALRTWQFWVIVLSLLGFTMGEGTIVVHIVTHARGLGVSAAAAALIITIIGAVSMFSRIITGTAADKIGNKSSWVICLGLGGLSLGWLLLARELWLFYLFALVFGFAYGGLSVLPSPMVAEHFGLKAHGVVFGTVIMFGGTGGMALGPLIAGYLFDLTQSYNPSFLIFAITSAIGLVLMLFLKPVKTGGNEPGT